MYASKKRDQAGDSGGTFSTTSHSMTRTTREDGFVAAAVRSVTVRHVALASLLFLRLHDRPKLRLTDTVAYE